MSEHHQHLLDRITFAIAAAALAAGAALGTPRGRILNLLPTRLWLAVGSVAALAFLATRPQARRPRAAIAGIVASAVLVRALAAVADFGATAILPLGIGTLATLAIARAAYPGADKP